MSGTLSHLTIASLSMIAAGATVEATIGFGCNLVWISFFPLFTTVHESVGVHQPLGLCLNLLILRKTWHHCSLAELRPLSFTVPVGIVAGLWAVTSWPVQLINASLGVFLLCYTTCCAHSSTSKSDGEPNMAAKEHKEDKSDTSSANIGIYMFETGEANEANEEEESSDDSELSNSDSDSITRPLAQSASGAIDSTTWRRRRRRHFSWFGNLLADMSVLKAAAGFFGGCLTSAFGTGGPAILVYAREAGWESEPARFRANLQLIFFLMHIMAITSMSLGGVVTLTTARASLALLPALFAGGMLGNRMSERISKALFKKLVVYGLRIIGVVFIAKAALS